MLDHIKITFINSWNLQCVFPDDGTIQKLRLGYEIQNNPTPLFENCPKNHFNNQLIDYQSITNVLFKLRNSINQYFFDEYGYEILTEDNSYLYKYQLYRLQESIFSNEMLFNSYELEMSFRLDGQKTIGYFKRQNSLMFENFSFIESFNNKKSSNVKNDDNKCYDFLLKIKLK